MGLVKRVGLLRVNLGVLIVLLKAGGGLEWLGVLKMEWMRLLLLRSVDERYSERKAIAYHISLNMPARGLKVSPCDLDPSLKMYR